MYDAAGVRRAAGKQAACLNRIIMDIYKQELKEAGGKLKELLGHTPLQVVICLLFIKKILEWMSVSKNKFFNKLSIINFYEHFLPAVRYRCDRKRSTF